MFKNQLIKIYRLLREGISMANLNDVILERLSINGHICGEFVEFSFSQSFRNNSDESSDWEYSFPLPETAVLTGLEIRLGDRVLQSAVEDKEEVEKIVGEGTFEGLNPLKLETFENNHYKLVIKDILPRENVKIKVSYMDHMIYEDNCYQLTLPKIISSEESNPNKFYFNIIVKSMGELDITSSSHKINIEREDETLCKVTLKDGEVLNKDFELELKEVHPIEAGGMCYTIRNEEEQSILYLSLFPKLEEDESEEGKNYIFIVDKSSSMVGDKLEKGKNALQLCLRSLDKKDTFNIIAFDEEVNVFSETGKVAFNQQNLKRATEFIDSLTSNNEEENILEALKIALNEKNENGFSTILLFTDDNVEDEDEILDYVKNNIGDNRIFPFGMDTSVNSFFINKLAEIGYGRPEFIYPDESIEDIVIRQFNRIDNPQVDVVKIDWGNLDVVRTYPRSIEYLYDREPFSMFALVNGEVEGNITIIGKVGEKDYHKRIDLDSFDIEENVHLIERAWSRMRIESISEKMRGERGEVAESMRKKIVELSRESGILSSETSLLMIENFQDPVLGVNFRKVAPLIGSEETLKDMSKGYFLDSPRFLNTFDIRKKTKNNIIDKENPNKDANYSRDNILRILARNQFAEGSFDNSEESTLYDRVENTCMVLLAFGLGREDVNIYLNQTDKGIRYVARTVIDVEEILDEKLCTLITTMYYIAEKKGMFKSRAGEEVKASLDIINNVIEYKEYAILEHIIKLNRMDVLTEISMSLMNISSQDLEAVKEIPNKNLSSSVGKLAKAAIAAVKFVTE